MYDYNQFIDNRYNENLKMINLSALTRILMALTMAILVSACQREIGIIVVGKLGHPEFFFQSKYGGERPCVTRVWVTNPTGVATSPSGLSFVWAIDTNGQCERLTSLRYGAVPSNFEVSHIATPLADGVAYKINVSGSGYVGSGTFKFVGGKYQMDDAAGN